MVGQGCRGAHSFSYKQYLHNKVMDRSGGCVNCLFVPPSMVDVISNAIFSRHHNNVSGILCKLWHPFDLEGMPRLLIILVKHHSDVNHWSVCWPVSSVWCMTQDTVLWSWTHISFSFPFLCSLFPHSWSYTSLVWHTSHHVPEHSTQTHIILHLFQTVPSYTSLHWCHLECSSCAQSSWLMLCWSCTI